MALAVKRMADLDLAGRRVLIREDLNAPLENGKVKSDTRLRAVEARCIVRYTLRCIVRTLERPGTGWGDGT